MIQEKNFSFLRDQNLALCVSGEPSRIFPLTFTLEEALEDWCDHEGVGFEVILGCYPEHHFSDLGSGKFSYKVRSGLGNEHNILDI